MSCGTRRHEARPGYVRLPKVWDGAGAKDPRLDPQALSELQEHPLPQGETLEVTLTRFFDAQEDLSRALAVAWPHPTMTARYTARATSAP